MHERLIAYLDQEDSSTVKLEELEVELEVRRARPSKLELWYLCPALLQVIYPNQGCFLMLDYARCSRPQYV